MPINSHAINVCKFCYVCLYVKTRIFFVQNHSEKERSTRTYIHVYMFGYVWVLVCLSHLIYWSFKPTVGVLMYFSASNFFFPCVSHSCGLWPSVCGLSVPPPLWTKKFWVRILFEQIEIIYSKFMRVDFYFGSSKVQMYGRMSKHNFLPDLTYENHWNYLFFEAPIFWFYEKSLIRFYFFANVLISMCLLFGLKIYFK